MSKDKNKKKQGEELLKDDQLDQANGGLVTNVRLT